jgi:hypothetical protein
MSLHAANDQKSLEGMIHEPLSLPKGEGSVYVSEKDSYIVTAVKGMEYSIKMFSLGVNHTGTNIPRRMAVHLSVDGVNTLGEAVTLPTQGKRWLLDSKGVLEIPGWQLDDGIARRFKFVTLDESVAYRLGQTESVGQVTALFYLEKDKGCPKGPLCRPVAKKDCKEDDVTPSCQCFQKDSEYSISCEDAGTCKNGCVRFDEPCTCFDKSGKKRLDCSKAKRCYTEDHEPIWKFGEKCSSKHLQPVKNNTILHFIGSAGTQENNLATGEGQQIAHPVENVQMEMETEPTAVLTIHYK